MSALEFAVRSSLVLAGALVASWALRRQPRSAAAHIARRGDPAGGSPAADESRDAGVDDTVDTMDG